jgi:hypothetical protein
LLAASAPLTIRVRSSGNIQRSLSIGVLPVGEVLGLLHAPSEQDRLAERDNRGSGNYDYRQPFPKPFFLLIGSLLIAAGLLLSRYAVECGDYLQIVLVLLRSHWRSAAAFCCSSRLAFFRHHKDISRSDIFRQHVLPSDCLYCRQRECGSGSVLFFSPQYG